MVNAPGREIPVNWRILQRELRNMVEKGVLVSEGATNRLIYRLEA
ncbi:hypothetical protein SAMN02745206_01405 [Desulfacinum infernum DSM 9756]|jgi:hypothetical protein|uniref:Uncharacterized protein n=1 Tax=Desulfacinum infernum DSM 9756 TaxID=1121391 RepID=A0A1M4Z582_9BACT|nr:hypothetical protein SAMN02745206_01405 [Desulfacinum infernum DSM 9756]